MQKAVHAPHRIDGKQPAWQVSEIGGGIGLQYARAVDPIDWKDLEGQQKWGFQVTWSGECKYQYGLCDSQPAFSTAFFANWAYTAPADTPPPAGGHSH